MAVSAEGPHLVLSHFRGFFPPQEGQLRSTARMLSHAVETERSLEAQRLHQTLQQTSDSFMPANRGICEGTV